jgi:uncharacterized protein YqjF (DUF2071 family)
MDAVATQPSFLRAAWRNLLMINFAIGPDRLRPFVPRGTELDQFNGATFVSVVGFQFLNTRLLGVPVPCHRDFEEVNLRFYVRRRHQGEWRRGVVFVKEIVPKRLVALVARRVYNENYVRLPMRSHIDPREASVGYEWRYGGRWHGAFGQFRGASAFVAPGSEEEFITEHYWGYSVQRDGSTVEYQVEHPRWRVWSCTDARLDCDALTVYGGQFVASLDGRPTSAFVADGSAVIVRRGRRLASHLVESPDAN